MDRKKGILLTGGMPLAFDFCDRGNDHEGEEIPL